jgi:hypothetical protein
MKKIHQPYCNYCCCNLQQVDFAERKGPGAIAREQFSSTSSFFLSFFPAAGKLSYSNSNCCRVVVREPLRATRLLAHEKTEPNLLVQQHLDGIKYSPILSAYVRYLTPPRNIV